MPTLITHPAVALLKTWFPRVPVRIAVAGAVLSMLPDFDVIGFRFDIAYGSTFGLRGFTHSILFALVTASLATLLCGTRLQRGLVFAFLFLCAISHPVLDAFTDGGLGVAFFSPFSNERYFFPWHPLRVAPIGARFFRARGLETLKSELVWVWIPCVVAALIGRYASRYKGDQPS
jgi:inner membrane protein